MDRTEIIFLFYGIFLCSHFFSVTGDCIRPSINEDEIAISPDKASYSLYEAVTVTCIRNATLIGITSKVSCDDEPTNNGWHKDFSLADCLDDCSLASLDDNVRATDGSNIIEGVLVKDGTIVHFECVGIVSGHPSSTCSDGSWSTPFPVCILDTAPTTSTQMPSTHLINTTTSVNMTSSSILPTIVTDGDKTTLPGDDLTTKVADTTDFMNATATTTTTTTTTTQFTTNVLGKTDTMTTVVAGTTPNKTIKVTEFKETTEPRTTPTINLVDVTDVQTTFPRLADMSTTMSAGMMTTKFNLTTSKSQFTDPPLSTEIINGTVIQTEILTTELGLTTPKNDQKATDIDVTTKQTVTTMRPEGETDTTEKETLTTIFPRVTTQTDIPTDGQFSTHTTSNIVEITDDMTTKLILTTKPTTSGDYMTTHQPQTTYQPTGIKSTPAQNMTSKTDFLSTIETGEESTIKRFTTDVRDLTTVQLQTVIQTELITETYPTVTSKQTEKSGMTSQQDAGKTDDGRTTTLQLTKLSTTGVRDMTTKDLLKTSYTIQPTGTDHTSGYHTTSSKEYSSTMQPGEKFTTEADKTDGAISTTMRPQTMIETEVVTDEISFTKVTTDTDTSTTSVQATSLSITAKTDDGETTKLDPTTSPSLLSTNIIGMTTMQDSFTSPVTTRLNTVGRDVTTPKETYITTVIDGTTFETGMTSTLGNEVTTYLTTEITRVTTPSLVGKTDVSDSTAGTTNQISSTDITTKVDLKTETSVPTTKENDTVPTSEGKNLSTAFTNQPTIETELISEEASSTTPVLRETTEIYERLTTAVKTSEKVTTNSEIMTTDPEKVTTSSDIMTTSPKKLTTTSEIMTTSPGKLTTTFEIMTTDPEKVTTSSDIMTTSPKKLTTTSEIVTTSPGKLTTTSEIMTTDPEKVTTFSDIVTTSPKIVTTTSEIMTTSPEKLTTTFKKMTTDPEKVTTSSDIVTTSPKKVTTTSEIVTTSPGKLTTTSEIITSSPERVTTIPEKMTTSSEKVTTGSDKMTSSSVRVTESDSTITTKVSETTTSPTVTDEPKDASTSGEKTSISTTSKTTSTSSTIMATSKHRTTSKTTTSPTTCDDILCTLPSARKCDNSGQLPVCVCREGYFRKNSEQTCTEAESFQNSIRVVSRTNGQMVYYNRQLEDSTSERFISLADDICTAIDAIFENYNSAMRFYLGCKVLRFRQGSIIVDFVTYFRTSSSITEDDNKQIIELSLEANDVLPSSDLVIDPDSITSQPTNECDLGLDDCDYWNADCIDEGASGYSCQCKDGYRDGSPESLPGRTCTEVSVNVALLVSILLILMLVILVLVLVYISLTLRRTKVLKGHQKEYRSPIHVDSEIALYAMGEVTLDLEE